MPLQNVLIAGQWRASKASGTFRAENPATREPLPDEYPVSTWQDCDEALGAAVNAFEELRRLSVERIAAFLDAFAARIEAHKTEIVQMANHIVDIDEQTHLKLDLIKARTRSADQASQPMYVARLEWGN